jgi:hypothetical protein
VQWQWANGLVYALDPLFFLDPQLEVGQISASPPDNPAQWTAYGFTADSELAAEREYTELRSRLFYDHYYLWQADRVVKYRFHYAQSREILSCSQLIVDDENRLRFQRWGELGWSSCTYSCAKGRVESFVRLYKAPDEPERHVSGEVVYKDDGVVELWTKELSERKPRLAYRGKRQPQSIFIRSLCAQQG